MHALFKPLHYRIILANESECWCLCLFCMFSCSSSSVLALEIHHSAALLSKQWMPRLLDISLFWSLDKDKPYRLDKLDRLEAAGSR